MEVVILSVPHTGTNFCKRLFRDKGWEDVALNTSAEQENAFYVGHIRNDDLFHRGVELAKSRPLIVPLRHPYRVEESWRRRKKPRPIAEMVEGFRLIIDLLPMSPYVLPVDSDKREHCLSDLSEGIGVELETDWPLIGGETGTHNLAIEECDPSDKVIHLVEDMQPLLSRYY